MSQNREALDEQLTSLEQSFVYLGTQLSQIAREIADFGAVLPSDKLIEDLTAARIDFVDLRNRILELATSLAVSPLPQPDEIITLQDLRVVLEDVGQAEAMSAEVEQIRQRALTVLDRILALVYCGSGHCLPLAECQAKACELRSAVSDVCRPALHPDIAALAAGKHPFAALLDLSERWRDLDPEDWHFLQAIVEESCGTELSVAAARGNLIIPDETVVATTPTVPEKIDKVSRLVEPSTSEERFLEDLALKPQEILKSAVAVVPPIAEVVQSLQDVASGGIPSVESDKLVTTQPIRQLSTIHPNAPCPCGSGKKYKRCCRDIPRADTQQRFEEREGAGFERTEYPQRQAQQEGLVLSKGIKPINRGGRSHGRLTQDREVQVKQRARPPHPKPEIVCWKRERQWMVAIEVPEELQEQSGLEILQNAACLVQDEFKEDCWLLQQAYGQAVIHWNEDEEARKTTIVFGEERYLLFKLRGQGLDQGRCVASLSTGSYLAIVPENWECDEESSEANPVEPEFVSLNGYRAHFYAFEEDRDGQITFCTPEGKRIVIKARTSWFELVGTRLQDAGQGVGPLFGSKPPQLRILSGQEWTGVGAIVVGEEGSGKQRWRTQFRPDTEHQEQDVPSEVTARGGGWYFVRMYDTNDNLLESLDFRFVCALQDIIMPSLSSIPSEEGHKTACVKFLHEPGCDIQLADSLTNSVQIERREDTIIAIIPPCQALDETQWSAGSENTHRTQITVLIERLWWAIGEEHNAPSDWQDRPLTLRRRDFAPTSRMALWLRFPRPRWVDSVRVGFDQQQARPYPVKVDGNSLAIPLQDFYDTQEITDGIGIYRLNLHLYHQDIPYEVTNIFFIANLGCKFCNIESIDEEEMFRHILSDHITEYFRSLTYEEMRIYDRSLPLVIYNLRFAHF